MAAGERRTVDLPISVLSNHTPMTLSVHVVHGSEPGPTLFVSAGVHGDEVLGVEIVRRLLKVKGLQRMAGTLLAVPIVNEFGFIAHSRYLPDRRDLNRSFPGSTGGSLAGQLAELFMREVVRQSDLGIDLHTAALHRHNLPQLRIGDASERVRELARHFGAPVVVESGLRDGSLRKAAGEAGVDVLLYEAGEALRFDEFSIRIGVRGVMSVMHALEMLPAESVRKRSFEPLWATSSTWLRAPKGGVFRAFRKPGDLVEAGERIAFVSDPFGQDEMPVEPSTGGLVIGRTNLPVVNRGDALFHIATVSDEPSPGAYFAGLAEELNADPLFDEEQIL